MALIINEQEIEEVIGSITDVSNTNVIKNVEQLAKVVREEADQTAVMGQLLDACKKFQDVFNTGYKPSIDTYLSDASDVKEIGEWMRTRASVSTITSNVDAHTARKVQKDVIM